MNKTPAALKPTKEAPTVVVVVVVLYSEHPELNGGDIYIEVS